MGELKSRRGSWAIILVFMVIIMFILLFAFFSFLTNIFEGGPEYNALNSFAYVLNEVCAEPVGYETSVEQYAPDSRGYQQLTQRLKYYGYNIETDKDIRYLRLSYRQKQYWQRYHLLPAEVDKTLKKIKLNNCAGVTFTGDVIFEPDEGAEYIKLTAKKTAVSEVNIKIEKYAAEN